MVDYRTGVTTLIDQFAQASISLSVDYYDAMRVDAGVPGSYNPTIISPPSEKLISTALDYATQAQAFMADVEADIQRQVDEAAQRLVADAGRDQVVGAVAGDELALGFARVASPTACAFCVTLAIRRKRGGRPGVYKSRATAGQLPPNATGQINRYHWNCNCVVVPVFATDYELEAHLADLEKLYDEATLNSKRGQSLNDFRRALDAMRRGEKPPPPSAAPSAGPSVSQADQLAALIRKLGG